MERSRRACDGPAPRADLDRTPRHARWHAYRPWRDVRIAHGDSVARRARPRGLGGRGATWRMDSRDTPKKPDWVSAPASVSPPEQRLLTLASEANARPVRTTPPRAEPPHAPRADEPDDPWDEVDTSDADERRGYERLRRRVERRHAGGPARNSPVGCEKARRSGRGKEQPAAPMARAAAAMADEDGGPPQGSSSNSRRSRRNGNRRTAVAAAGRAAMAARRLRQWHRRRRGRRAQRHGRRESSRVARRRPIRWVLSPVSLGPHGHRTSRERR